jgi:peptidoglycan/LPS O-acetylase OafA/YrhL
MSKGTSSSHYYVVDLIRMIAACLVVLYHFALFDNSLTGKIAFPFLWPFGAVGDIGVEIFFVISGLVIAMSAENARGLQGAVRFIQLRASRILPALWISSLIGFAVLSLAGGSLPTLSMLLMKSATLSPIGPYIDGVVWSLVVEAVFYMTVGITIIAAPRISLETLAKIICAASTIYLAVWTVAFLTNEPLFELLSRFPSKVFLLRYGVFFALGMLLWSSLRGNRSASIGGTMLLAGIMCVLEIFTHKDLMWGASIAAASIWLAAISIMIFCIVHADAIESRLSNRDRKVIRYLGSYSYPLYLNHYTFGGLIMQSLLKVFQPVSQLSLTIVFIASVGAVSAMAAFVTSAEKVAARRFRSRPLGAIAVEPT